MATAMSIQQPSPAPPDLAELMRSIVKFVSEYQWVYDVQVTRFFELRWWEKIPEEVGYRCCIECEWHCGNTYQILWLMIGNDDTHWHEK